MTLEKEQWDDLSWATDVLAGNGDEHDEARSARNMLEVMMTHGATQKIRQKASVLLVSGMETAA
jgi:hypothetical protein